MIEELLISLTVFVLAMFVGYSVITKVPPTLHTPLMSGSNAISGIVIVGALVSSGPRRRDGGYRPRTTVAHPGHNQRRRRVPGDGQDAANVPPQR